MRRKRSHRNKNKRHKTMYRVSSIVAITIFGISQITIPTHALLTARSAAKDKMNSFKAAFVFPKTVNDLVQKANAAASAAAEQNEAAHRSLDACRDDEVSSKAAHELLNQVSQAAERATAAANDADHIANVLSGYFLQAQLDLNRAQAALDSLNRQQNAIQLHIQNVQAQLQTWMQAKYVEDGTINTLAAEEQLQQQLQNLQSQMAALQAQMAYAQVDLQSAKRVFRYVQPAYVATGSSATSARNSAQSAAQAVVSTAAVVNQKEEKEKAAAEKQKADANAASSGTGSGDDRKSGSTETAGTSGSARLADSTGTSGSTV